MFEGEDGNKYVLVLKDGMSGYVELIACAQPNADQVYLSLIDWFKRFGVAHQWVSDQGAHFKNQVIEKLQRALGAHHHFTTAYTPWANGTVEVVNREVLKCVKALLSEKKLRPTDWARILPVVQAALNSMPSDRLGGTTPLTAFTALPGETQLRSILHPRDPFAATIEWVDDDVQRHLAAVQVALEGMHREMTDASEKKKRAARERHAKRQGVTLPKFSDGDFVLVATATGRTGNKLALLWKGSKRIVRTLSDYTFEVQDLVAPFEVTVRHTSRLQLYRDAVRGSEEELIEQAIHDEGGHLVQALRTCRLSPDTQRWKIQVQWVGLDEIEASWEPAETVQEDVQVFYQAYVDEQSDGDDRRRMAEAVTAIRQRVAPSMAPRVPRTRQPPARITRHSRA